MNTVTTFVTFLVHLHCTLSLDSRHILFVIASETGSPPLPRASVTWATLGNNTGNTVLVGDPYHDTMATELKRDIELQVLEEEGRLPIIYITHEEFSESGAWTIVRILRPIVERHNDNVIRWLMFIQPRTVVNYLKLLNGLQRADSQETEILWMGNLLYSGQYGAADYIGHFALGFAMRMDLVIECMDELERQEVIHYVNKWTSDPSEPFALFVIRVLGLHFVRSSSFCIKHHARCATYLRKFNTCGREVPEESIYFAVKTWSVNNGAKERIVKETWGRAVSNIVFYSDLADVTLPMVKLDMSNGEGDYCDGTIAILNQVVNEVQKMPHIKWIVLVNENTVLGVRRLCEVLSCYLGGDNLTFIGERTGIQFPPLTVPEIFNADVAWLDMITMGGGVVLSVGAARKLASCKCFGYIYADMHLAWCARHHGIYLSHSPLFHQFLPDSYPSELLALDKPVSFRFAWRKQSDRAPLYHARRIYDSWFEAQDRPLRQRKLRAVESPVYPL